MRQFRVLQKVRNIHKYVLLATLAIGAGIATLAPGSAFAGTFTSQPISSTYTGIGDVTAANGLLWMIAVHTGDTIGRYIISMSPSGTTQGYNIPALSGLPITGLGSLTTGSDGNVWFEGSTTSVGGSSTMLIGKIDVSTGSVTTWRGTISNANVYGVITSDASGNIWYRAKSTGTPAYTYLESLNPSTGVTTTVYTFDQNSIVYYTASLDGKIWTTDAYYHNLQSFTASGLADTYTIPTPNDTPNYLTSSSDGALWFTKGTNFVKFTPSGGFTTYALPTGTYVSGVTAGPNGTMWFVDSGTTRSIGKITSSGTIMEYPVPSVGTPVIGGIAWGPAGAVWFPYSDSNVNKLGRFDPITSQTVSFTSTAPTSAIIDGPTYTPTATATSGLPVAITVDPASSGVCSIDGSGKVSFQTAGTCTIDANQAGNADYNPAAQVQQSFTVAPVDADTSVALSCPATAHIGDTVSCTITVTNNGPATASNATLTALVPSSLSGVSISGGGTLSGQTITWTPSLASGSSAILTVSGAASTASKTQFNAALLQTSPDTNISNNIANSTLVISN